MKAAVLAALLVFSYPAQAQSECYDHAKLVELLRQKYNEKFIGRGTSTGVIVELFVSPNGSWTIIYTAPSGQSCPVITGENWLREEQGRKS